MIGNLPRFPLALLPTPLHRAHRIEAALRQISPDVGPLLLKRDDLIGFGVAGNKARALVHERAAVLRAAGRRPYAVPRGGSTPLGAVGFAVAAAELAVQLDQPPALVVIAVGSGA